MESTDILQIREWLTTQEAEGYSLSHKAALIRSCEPFGLIADYKDDNGTIYEYFNGELQAISTDKTRIRVGENN
ncbi:MAG: hypothetical protein ACON4B_07405 [Flavobacteriaceae bacterium]